MGEAAPAAQKSSGGLSRLVLWLIVIVLLGAVWWLASERNERRFRLEADNGVLVVSRGRFFPIGQSAIRADDSALGKVYGPLPIPPGAKLPPGELEYEDQTALDRALFDLLVPWSKQLQQKGDSTAVEQAGALADRASALPGLTAAQHAQLAALRGDLAFYSARGDLKAAAQLVQVARRKLAAAREGAGDHALEAGALVGALDQVGAALLEGAEGRLMRVPLAPQAEPAPAQQPGSPTAQPTSPAAPSPAPSAAVPPLLPPAAAGPAAAAPAAAQTQPGPAAPAPAPTTAPAAGSSAQAASPPPKAGPATPPAAKAPAAHPQ